MASLVNWGEGGATAGGTGVLLGSSPSGSEGARVAADGSTLPPEIKIGEGGCTAGGEAEVQ